MKNKIKIFNRNGSICFEEIVVEYEDISSFIPISNIIFSREGYLIAKLLNDVVICDYTCNKIIRRIKNVCNITAIKPLNCGVFCHSFFISIIIKTDNPNNTDKKCGKKIMLQKRERPRREKQR